MERIRITKAGPLTLAPPINLLAIVASSARSKCISKYLFSSILLPYNFIKSAKVPTFTNMYCVVFNIWTIKIAPVPSPIDIWA